MLSGYSVQIPAKPRPCSFPKNMGNKTLLECCYDNVWGNGHPLSNPDCLNSQKYTTQGIQGEMLEEIRVILHAPNPDVQRSLLSGNSSELMASSDVFND